MSNDLKSIISEIKFPVRYDPDDRWISDDNEIVILELMPLGNHHAFGEELARLINTLDPKSLIEVCVWMQEVDSYGCYHSACGGSFMFNDGGLKENHIDYCCYCGKEIEEVNPNDEEE